MAYTRAWSLAAPLGSVQAKDIDLLFRQLKEDFEERLESSLIVDMTADPLVLRDEIIGKFTGKTLLLPASAFIGGTYIPSTGRIFGGDELVAALNLAPGSVITKLEFLVERTGGANITAALYATQFTTGAVARNVVVASPPSVTAGKHIITINTVQQLQPDYSYDVQIIETGGGTANLYGVRVTYNSPSNFAAV
jgi:hypothetical protein